jgi:hypothetical protein
LRAVSADHVLFDECIYTFRRENDEIRPTDDERGNAYILTSFKLPERWVLPYCVIEPSISVELPGDFAAFICKVENPAWVSRFDSHLFGMALASIVSFVTGRHCKSTRDGYLCDLRGLDRDRNLQLAIQYPVLISGPGCENHLIAASRLNEYHGDIFSLISALHSVKYNVYKILMQAIRLVHLSLANKKEDFGLAYYLLVSAIEVIAKEAVSVDSVREKNPSEEVWIAKAQEEGYFCSLYDEYKKLRGANKHLNQRYVTFISRYCPKEKWKEIIDHPNQQVVEFIRENSIFTCNLDDTNKKQFYEIYPEDLSEDDVRNMLSKSYAHRSWFVHQGKQPPHREPRSYTRFFQEVYRIDGHCMKKDILPNYELLLGIARRSISEWTRTQCNV